MAFQLTRRDLHGVYPYGLPVQVDQRPAGVAEGDGGVGLDVVGHVAVPEAELEAIPGNNILEMWELQDFLGAPIFYNAVANLGSAKR